MELKGYCSLPRLLILLGLIITSSAQFPKVFAMINSLNAKATIDSDFLCVTMDWWPPEKCDYGVCAWGNTGVINNDFSQPEIIRAMKALSPVTLRIGGSLEDMITYDFNVDDCPDMKPVSWKPGFQGGCLTPQRWDIINKFCKDAGCQIAFGLSELTGRTRNQDGTWTGQWDSSNAADLIKYTAEHNYPVIGWQLGNELFYKGIADTLDVETVAADFAKLNEILNQVYKSPLKRPLMIGPDSLSLNGFTQLRKKLQEKGFDLDIYTYHLYSLGAGVSDKVPGEMRNATYLDQSQRQSKEARDFMKETGEKVWLGEGGGAYNSGKPDYTNAFISGFWWLDQMAQMAGNGHRKYCRQTFMGGNYELVNKISLLPNPDYYTSYLWNRLVGTKILQVTRTDANTDLRAYAACGKVQGDMIFIFINLSDDQEYQVHLGFDQRLVSAMRYHYEISSDSLLSQRTYINGEEVKGVDDDGNIIGLKEHTESPLNDVFVKPKTYGFVHYQGSNMLVCNQMTE